MYFSGKSAASLKKIVTWLMCDHAAAADAGRKHISWPKCAHHHRYPFQLSIANVLFVIGCTCVCECVCVYVWLGDA